MKSLEKKDTGKNIRLSNIFSMVLLLSLILIFKSFESVRSVINWNSSLDEVLSVPKENRRDDGTENDNSPEVAEATAAAEILAPETSILAYSYNTTNVREFRELHREYILRQQEKLGDSHLSTKDRDKDDDGNLMTTYKFRHCRFIAGFRNQMMALTMLVIQANYHGHQQMDFRCLRLKDTYGTNKLTPFDVFFDVEHWNKYSYTKERAQDIAVPPNTSNPERYPNWLPRMVLYDHNETEDIAANITRLYTYDFQGPRLTALHMRYGKGYGPFLPHPIGQEKKTTSARNPAEILMLQGALRPHPALQAVVDRSKEQLRQRMLQMGTATTSSTTAATKPTLRYMALHARVEPDMQKHMMCKAKKVLTLQEIVDMIESKWPEPPVDAVFLPINRQYLEKEGTLPKDFKNDTDSAEKVNWVAVSNLDLLNRLTNHNGPEDKNSESGLWNGTVPVVEFGTEALSGTVYENRPSLAGSILNYYLAVDADIFIGTEVSSWSHDLLATRFYRGSDGADTNSNTDGETKNTRKNNYKYLPSGLENWVEDDMIVPPNFLC